MILNFPLFWFSTRIMFDCFRAKWSLSGFFMLAIDQNFPYNNRKQNQTEWIKMSESNTSELISLAGISTCTVIYNIYISHFIAQQTNLCVWEWMADKPTIDTHLFACQHFRSEYVHLLQKPTHRTNNKQYETVSFC